MKPLLRLGVGILLLASSPVLGDTISLTNGRQLQGRVLSQTDSAVTLEVPGGRMDLPRSQIARIDLAPSLDEEYGVRYLKIDPGEPDALDGLAAWCRAHHMDVRARYLQDQATGIRLERRFEKAKTADDFFAVADWAEAQGFSTEVRRLAVSRALELAPRSARALDELARLDREDEAARRAADEETARRLDARERDVRARERAVALAEQAVRGQAETPPPREAEKTETQVPGTTEPPADDGGDPPVTGVILVRPHPHRDGQPVVVGGGASGKTPPKPLPPSTSRGGSTSSSK